MFNTLLKDHRAKSASRRRHLDGLRADALHSAEVVTQHLFDEVQNGVGLVYANQRALQNESRLLAQHTQRLSKQSDRWLQLAAQLNDSLKELGDVQNWALTVQKDVRWIETNLESVVDANATARRALQERREADLARAQAEREAEAARRQAEKEAESARKQAMREEAERRDREERERKAAAKLAAQQQQQQQQAMAALAAAEADQVEHVDGEDEELP